MKHSLLALLSLCSLIGCEERTTPVRSAPLAVTGASHATASASAPLATERTARDAPPRSTHELVAVHALDQRAITAFDQYAPVLADDGLRVVLASATDDAWGRGAPVVVARGETVIVRRDVDASALPTSLAAHAGTAVRLMDDRGERCEATLGAFTLTGRVVPHFGARQRWDDGTDAEGNAIDAAHIAREAWDLTAEGGRVLTAEVHPTRGDCSGARWARALDLPDAPVARADETDASLRALALAQLHALPSYRALQRRFARETGARGDARWEDSEGAQLAVRSMAIGGATLVAVWAHVEGTCGGFAGHVSAVWEVRRNSARTHLIARGEVDRDGLALPIAAVDVDGDAQPELVLSDGALLRQDGVSGYQVRALRVPYFDCTC